MPHGYAKATESLFEENALNWLGYMSKMCSEMIARKAYLFTAKVIWLEDFGRVICG